jgi:hypothetical protein
MEIWPYVVLNVNQVRRVLEGHLFLVDLELFDI